MHGWYLLSLVLFSEAGDPTGIQEVKEGSARDPEQSSSRKPAQEQALPGDLEKSDPREIYTAAQSGSHSGQAQIPVSWSLPLTAVGRLWRTAQGRCYH